MPDPSAMSALAPARVVSPDGPELPMLQAVSRALRQRDCDDLDRVPVLGRREELPVELRWHALAHEEYAEAVPPDRVDRIDAEAVAAWLTGRYPAGPVPALVLGSAHGGAAHLAAALGAPWLPTTFTVTVPWPDGNAGDWTGAMEWGAKLADLVSKLGKLAELEELPQLDLLVTPLLSYHAKLVEASKGAVTPTSGLIKGAAETKH